MYRLIKKYLDFFFKFRCTHNFFFTSTIENFQNKCFLPFQNVFLILKIRNYVYREEQISISKQLFCPFY